MPARRAAPSTPPLNLIHKHDEVFRGLRRNIRGQHINFYSRVIHKAKWSIKTLVSSLIARGFRGQPESLAGETAGLGYFSGPSWAAARLIGGGNVSSVAYIFAVVLTMISDCDLISPVAGGIGWQLDL